jgi:hypothetical protein
VIELHQLGELHLEAPPAAGRPRHLAAGSGLVVRDGRLWVVSDEEVGLATFHPDQLDAGRMHRLADEHLPHEPGERKAAKPDLEALCELPPRPEWPSGALLTVGSGATEQRRRGWVCRPGADGTVDEAIEISLHALYALLDDELPDLNVEGAAIAGDRLWIAQRGNGEKGANVLIALDLEVTLRGLAADRAVPAEPVAMVSYDLGEADGVALTFSDLAPLPGGRLAYAAAAEAGGSTYHDGETTGAAIGALAPGEPLAEPPRATTCPHKIEGISRQADGTLLLVADPDDPDVPSPVFLAHAELG